MCRATRVLLISLIGFAPPGLIGCGSEPAARSTNCFVVEGQLLVGGKPAPFASLAFHPVADGANIHCAVGISDGDGSFRLRTSHPGDGAPPGEYIITVLWPDPTSPIDECECPDPTKHDLLRGDYANRTTSQLRATVHPGENRIVLKLEVPRGGLNTAAMDSRS